MTNHHEHTGHFDCGDGAPALQIIDDTTAGPTALATKPAEAEQAPTITITMFVAAAAVLTQLLIGGAVIFGADPVVGIVAAITVLTCSLTLIVGNAITPNR